MRRPGAVIANPASVVSDTSRRPGPARGASGSLRSTTRQVTRWWVTV